MVTSSKGNPFRGLHREGDLKDMMEWKIPTLLTFLSNRQLDKKKYSTWVMQMEAMLESYDLAFMVLQDVPWRLTALADDFLDSVDAESYRWDRLNARICSFIVLNCTPVVLAHIQHLTSVRQIWLLLGHIYNRMTLMKWARLEVTMQQLEPSNFASMKDFIDKVQIMQ